MNTATKVTLGIATVAAMIVVPVAMQHRASPPVVAAETNSSTRSAPPAGSDPQATSKPQTPEPATEPKHYRPAPISAAQQQTVDAILRRHKGMTKEQLVKSKELNDLLNRSMTLLTTPEVQRRVEEALADIQALKGPMQGDLNISFDNLDDPKGRAWLEAAVSMDADLMAQWLINRFNGSIFEFAFDPTLETTSEGISITPQKSDEQKDD